MNDLINLKALTETELREFMHAQKVPDYRITQMIAWIYERGVTDIDDITVFSKDLRKSLKEISYISSLEVLDIQRSEDGTEKYLFGLEDGLQIESVLIPDGDRLTLCVSSQVGCQMGCTFCRTSTMGFMRNLESHEIIDQVLCATRLNKDKRISNIVFMGMGEPLMNLPALVDAILRINKYLKISRRRITVSTSGLAEEIYELAGRLAEDDLYVNLAVSLNATTDTVRSSIMPVNRKYPIKQLMSAVKEFPLPHTRMITFEYVLIDNLNDSKEDAKRLAELVHGIPNKINIIPLNPFEGCELERPSNTRVDRFKKWVEQEGAIALVRKSKGQDILASCGQLASKKDEG